MCRISQVPANRRGRSCVNGTVTSEAEIEACVRADHARLVRVVAAVTSSVPLAEEAVQEAFARAWERSRRGEHFTSLPGWVTTVALNLARSGHRRRGAEERARQKIVAGRPGREPADVAAAVAVREAVDGLPARQRDAVVLYYLVDLDVATVASLLGVAEGTVKAALSRAREKLAARLADVDPEAQRP